MSTAKVKINAIRNASADGEITPGILAAALDDILEEASASSDLPEYLSQEKISAIATTANNALTKANSALASIQEQGGCACEAVTDSEFNDMIDELGLVEKKPGA